MKEVVRMKIFLICPVRMVSETEREKIKKYVASLEESGYLVHWPERDTDQNDDIGLCICLDNRAAIAGADEIHVWWNDKSQGSLFDFGMAFALEKKIVLANPGDVLPTTHKSFNNVLISYAKTKRCK